MKIEHLLKMTDREISEYLETKFEKLDKETKRLIATMMVDLEDYYEFLMEQGLLEDFFKNNSWDHKHAIH